MHEHIHPGPDDAVVVAGDNLRARVGDRGTAVAGQNGTAEASDHSVARVGENGTARVRTAGVAVCEGPGGTAAGGHDSVTVALSGGTAGSGDGGVAFVRDGGQASVYHHGVAVCRTNGVATAGGLGSIAILVSDEGGSSSRPVGVRFGPAGSGQSIVIARYMDPVSGRFRFRIGTAGNAEDVVQLQGCLDPETLYRLNECGEFEPVSSPKES